MIHSGCHPMSYLESRFVKMVSLLFFSLLLFPLACYAEKEDKIAAYEEDILAVDFPRSLRETSQFEGIDISVDRFIQANMDDNENVRQSLEAYGVDPSHADSLSSGQYKRFSFFDVMISDALYDVTVLCYRNGESHLALLFVSDDSQSKLVDTMNDVVSVEMINGLTNSWLQFTGSSFSDTLIYKWLYNLSGGTTEMGYLSHAVSPAPDFGADASFNVSGYSYLSEYSETENVNDRMLSVYHCYLDVVQHTSISSVEETAVVELYAGTKIDLYQYDYDLKRFVFLQTNHYDGVSMATLDNLLRPSLLQADRVVKRQ